MVIFSQISSILIAGLVVQATQIAPRDAPYAQIRFLECKDNSARAMGYNAAPPHLEQQPDEFLYHDMSISTFLPGCEGSGVSETQNVPWSCSFPPHDRGLPFQSYVGSVTYGNEGFNCFQDDLHFAFETPELHNCYTDLYCIQQEARNLSIAASKGAVSILTNITAEEVLGKVNERFSGQDCDATAVDLGGGCSISFQCHGVGTILQALAQVLTDVIAKQPDVFHFEVDEHHGPVVCLDPNTCVSGDPTYTGNLTMPASFSLTAGNIPWPGSRDQPSLQGSLDAKITCLPPVEDLSFCTALRLAASGAGLLPELGTIFGVVGLTASIACSF